jgi:hypothetical protein
MGLMSGGGPGLAALLGGGGGGSDIDSPIKLSATTTTRRRKSDEGHGHDGSDTSPSVQKRSKTSHNPQVSPTRPQQGHLGFKAAKTPHNKPFFVSPLATGKKQQQQQPPSSQEMVKETPISPVETNYGTAPVLTSTPKGVGVQYGWERRRTTIAEHHQEEVEDDIEEEEALLGGIGADTMMAGWSGEETM